MVSKTICKQQIFVTMECTCCLWCHNVLPNWPSQCLAIVSGGVQQLLTGAHLATLSSTIPHGLIQQRQDCPTAILLSLSLELCGEVLHPDEDSGADEEEEEESLTFFVRLADDLLLSPPLPPLVP